jgi:hypothetical protein
MRHFKLGRDNKAWRSYRRETKAIRDKEYWRYRKRDIGDANLDYHGASKPDDI